MNFKIFMSKEFTKRSFLFAKGLLYKIHHDGLTPASTEIFNATKFPILIVGREHYRETDKKYPIVDRTDLNKVVSLDFTDGSLLDSPIIGEQESILRAWILDEKVRELTGTKLLIWLPETWLFKMYPYDILYRLSRANNTIWVCQSQGLVYSSIAKGILADKSRFLMSVGVEKDIPSESIDEANYAQLLIKHVTKIDATSFLRLLKAQGYISKLGGALNWLSVAMGTSVGVLLFLVLHLAYLNFIISSLDDKISQQNVAEMIMLQKKYEDKKNTIESLEKALTGQTNRFIYWDVLATLMENGVTILLVNYDGHVLEVRGESELATSTLQLLTALPSVVKAEFITPVRESLGKERYTLAITLVSRVNNSE